MSHILSLVEGVPSANNNRIIIAQSGTAIFALLLLFITTQTQTTRQKAKKILVDCIVTYIFSREGGWEILEQLRMFIDSVIEQPISTKKYSIPPHHPISLDDCYSSLLFDILTSMKDCMTTNKPKRKDPTGAMFYEGFALSTYRVMCYCLGITPPCPRKIDATDENAIVSDHPTEILEVNMIDAKKMQLLVMAVDFWPDLVSQLTSPTDICLADSSKHTNTPLLEKGLIPILLRSIQAVLVFSMRQLFERKQPTATLSTSITRYFTMLESILYTTNILTKIKGTEVIPPKNDWSNQLLFNSSIILFSLISVCTRVSSAINPQNFTTQKEAEEFKLNIKV